MAFLNNDGEYVPLTDSLDVWSEGIIEKADIDFGFSLTQS